MLSPTHRTTRNIPRAARDASGTAAIEFALIAPLLLVILLAGTEVTQAVMAARKVSTATRTVADLTAQIRGATPLTDAMLDEIHAAGKLIIAPYSHQTLKLTISRVDVTNVNDVPTARTVWTATRNGGTARPCAVLNRVANAATPDPGAFPDGMHYEGRFIIADIRYVYPAILSANFNPEALGFGAWRSTAEGIEVRRTAYMQMRIDGNPTMTGEGACPTS